MTDGDLVLVTRGTFSEFSVTRYNRYGVINDPDLPYLSSGRWSHACTKYLNDQQKTVKQSKFVAFYAFYASIHIFRFILWPGDQGQMAQDTTQQRSLSGVLLARALGIYRILIKITQKQWIKDEYILNIGSVLILFVLLTVYRLDLF